MGWFDEQIKDRIRADNEAFEDSFVRAAGIIMTMWVGHQSHRQVICRIKDQSFPLSLDTPEPEHPPTETRLARGGKRGRNVQLLSIYQ